MYIQEVYTKYVCIIVNNLLPISKFSDLGRGYSNIDRNYVIGIPEKTSGTYYLIKKIFEIYGIESIENGKKVSNGENKIYYISSNINNIIGLFVKGDIDGICILTSNKNPYIINLCKFKAVKFIGIEYDRTKSDILKSFINPIYYKDFDPRVFFTTNYMSNKIITISSRSILIARQNINEEYIYSLIKIIYENIDSIRSEIDKYLYNDYRNNKLVDSLIKEHLSFANKNMLIHPGANKFYKEKKYITDNPNECFNNKNCKDIDLKNYWKYPIEDVELL